MKSVLWTDESGWRHRSLVLDSDSEQDAEVGILQDPPDMRQLDWDVVVRTLHNELVVRGLYTRADIQKQQNGVTGAILAALRRSVVGLYQA